MGAKNMRKIEEELRILDKCTAIRENNSKSMTLLNT